MEYLRKELEIKKLINNLPVSGNLLIRKKMRKKEEDVKNQIISSAQELFHQYGIKKTTMDEIAAESRKAKSTLYHYFKSKEEVIDAVIEKEVRHLRTIVKSKVEEMKDAKDKIRTYFLEFHLEIHKKLILYRLVRKDILKEIDAYSRYKMFMDFEKSYICRILEDGIDAGEIAEIQKEDIPWLAEILLAAFFGIVFYSIETLENGIEPDRLKKSIYMLLPKILL